MNNYLKHNAIELVNIIYSLCSWSKKNIREAQSSRNIIKIPPIFMSSNGGKEKLVALIHTMEDYNNGLKLKELPQRFNKHCNSNVVNDNDIRKIHNWMQQINFGLRAASIVSELNQNPTSTKSEISQKVYSNLCDKEGFSFVVREANEYKPLKYASKDVISKWLEKETEQIMNGQSFGIVVNENEKDIYGIKRHNDNIYTVAENSIYQLVKEAKRIDADGSFALADEHDIFLLQLLENTIGDHLGEKNV